MRPIRPTITLFSPCRLAVVCVLSLTAAAQTPPAGESKRMFGLIPNYKTVPSVNTSVPRMTVKDKFALAARDSFDPMAFVVAGMYAGVGQLARQNESWGLGAQGYGKRYGAAVADQVSGTFFQEAIVPALFHQDPRYCRKAEGSFGKRLRYALSRTFVIRSDAGKTQLNAPEFLGNAMQFALSVTYYPPESRTAAEVGTKYAAQIGSDAFFNVLKEFWPDLRRRMSRR
jgi:hypothetical protein